MNWLHSLMFKLVEMNDRALRPYATYIVVMAVNIANEESYEDRAATLIKTD